MSDLRVEHAAGDSPGGMSFADLFVGETNIFLRADVGGTVYVARVTDPTGVGPVTCSVIAGESAPAPTRDALLSGNVRAGVRGTTNRLPTDDFDARIGVRVGFAAYPQAPRGAGVRAAGEGRPHRTAQAAVWRAKAWSQV